MPNEFENRLSAGERELETALRALKPVTDVDPIACAYAAGVASASRSIKTWRAVAAVLAVGFSAMAFTSRLHDSSPPLSPGVATSLPDILASERSATRASEPHSSVVIHTSDAGRYPRLGASRFDGEADAFDTTTSGPDSESPPVRAGDFHWRPL